MWSHSMLNLTPKLPSKYTTGICYHVLLARYSTNTNWPKPSPSPQQAVGTHTHPREGKTAKPGVWGPVMCDVEGAQELH